MNELLRGEADQIISASLHAVLPDEAVQRALKQFRPRGGKTLLVATGKAAWQMANAAVKALGHVDGGVVVTKYHHVMGDIPGVTCYEAGHPVPDENSFAGTRKALELVQGLRKQGGAKPRKYPLRAEDTVLFLLSGGGSALFEQPLIPGEELQSITNQLLASGADIVEMNTLRKRLSGVKGGRFAQACAPAQVFSVVLSDILGDPLDMIASGPAYPDSSTCAQAKAVVEKYGLHLSPRALALLDQETPKVLDNVETQITGSVRELCAAAATACARLGYEPFLLTDRLCCEAREAGSFLASILRTHAGEGKRVAYIAGGETVVHLTGRGLGGRNQELALAAAPGIAGLEGAAVFSVGSDGTDGPCDAAGGYVDGDTLAALTAAGKDVFAVLRDNDAYHALQAVGGLVFTGPTGTNVNDVAVALLRG
ncbi:MAG: glycerate kinase [Clostridiales bacterium]|nr:glycerate kinase [Clostridiales bacterium]